MMEIDGGPRAPLDMECDSGPAAATGAAEDDGVLCTVCAVEISSCLPCLAQPRLAPAVSVPCCGVCHDGLAAEDGEDACAWCGDGGASLLPRRRLSFRRATPRRVDRRYAALL